MSYRATPQGHTAVMAQRVEAPGALDFFPTPPWATRALCERVLGKRPWINRANRKAHGETCWEPASGEGHMAEVLREYFAEVQASDVYDYGKGYAVGSFLGEGADVAQWKPAGHCPDWIITNPPFNKAAEFAERGLAGAWMGVALLMRTAWLEGGDRYRDVFRYRPPSIVAIFAERVPMMKGRWDPVGSTATSYAWFVWRLPLKPETRLMWIPPGQRVALEHAGDRRRFAPAPEPMTLFQEGT